MGVMRTVGFGRGAYLAYLGVQGATITLLGGLAGSLLAVGLVRFVRVNLAGVSLRPEPSADLLLATCAWVVLLTGLSVVVPAWQLGRRRVGDLLKTQ
jgi:ABC-type antimicrobial peptide transport system permease subunit